MTKTSSTRSWMPREIKNGCDCDETVEFFTSGCTKYAQCRQCGGFWAFESARPTHRGEGSTDEHPPVEGGYRGCKGPKFRMSAAELATLAEHDTGAAAPPARSLTPAPSSVIGEAALAAASRVDVPAIGGGLNPKDLTGSTKVDLALVPPSGLVACALAMTDGALKYDPYNWREQGKPVQARTYVSAALRHLLKWFEGEELSSDAGVHHLGHTMACCAILIDAQAMGQLVDNRPRSGATARLLDEGEAQVKALVKAAAERKAVKL